MQEDADSDGASSVDLPSLGGESPTEEQIDHCSMLARTGQLGVAELQDALQRLERAKNRGL